MVSIPRYGQSPSIGRPRSAFTLKSISPHAGSPGCWRCRSFPSPGPDRHRAGRNALHVGFLDHGGERLRPSGGPPASPGSGSPCAAWGCEVRQSRRGSPRSGRGSRCAGQASGVLLAVSRFGLALDFHLHQSLGGKADHPAQHRWIPRLRWRVAIPIRPANRP
jgi:hypothetical protein